MIRLTFIAALLLLPFSAADARTLYAIAVGDTDDNAIGASIATDFNSFTFFIQEIAEGLDCDRGTWLLSGERFSKNCLVETINGMSFNADDIAIFAFFGHGGRSVNDVSEFPQIMLGSVNDITNPNRYAENSIPLENVKSTLLNKGAGLVLVIGGCGNNATKALAPKELIPETRQPLQDRTRKKATDAVHSLFDAKGSITVTASSKNEYAWCNSTGSFFGQSFFDVFSDYIKSAGDNASWDVFLSKVKDSVVEKTKGAVTADGSKIWQTPVYEIDLH